jgi:hypothetical protein
MVNVAQPGSLQGRTSGIGESLRLTSDRTKRLSSPNCWGLTPEGSDPSLSIQAWTPLSCCTTATS